MTNTEVLTMSHLLSEYRNNHLTSEHSPSTSQSNYNHASLHHEEVTTLQAKNNCQLFQSEQSNCSIKQKKWPGRLFPSSGPLHSSYLKSKGSHTGRMNSCFLRCMEQRSWFPRKAQRRQCPAIKANPTTDAPRDDQEQPNHAQDRVDTDRTS